MNEIQWLTDGATKFPPIDRHRVERWISEVTTAHGKLLGPVNYIFCDDAKILDVNREFLRHDYYTDIITFDTIKLKHVKNVDSRVHLFVLRMMSHKKGCSKK